MHEPSAPDTRANARGASYLIFARGLRSFSQGYLNIIVPLYLASLGVSAIEIGLLITSSFLIGAVLLVPIGILADRYRRLPFLILFSVLLMVWGAVYLVSYSVILLLSISALAGVGRGGAVAGGGQAGPFSPAEQALLADVTSAAKRRNFFSLNSFASAIAAAGGAQLSGISSWLKAGVAGVPGLDGYHILFALTVAVGFITILLLWRVHEPYTASRSARPAVEGAPRKGLGLLSKRSARIVVLQSVAAGFNAFGIGFATTSIFAYWLYLRFQASTDTIGTVFTISYILGAGGIYLGMRLSNRIGTVRTIVLTRAVAAASVALIPVVPTFAAASSLQILSVALSTLVLPVRQSWTMGLFPSEERASAAGFTGVARRVTASISPSISGFFFNEGDLVLPFYLGAFMQGISALLYYRFFLGLDDRGGPPDAGQD